MQYVFFCCDHCTFQPGIEDDHLVISRLHSFLFINTRKKHLTLLHVNRRLTIGETWKNRGKNENGELNNALLNC